MVLLSKLFHDSLEHKTCEELLHSGSCVKNALVNVPLFLKANALYFAPTILVPLFMKIRKINKDVLVDTLNYYCGTVINGFITGWTIHVLICIFRNLFGKFKLPFFMFVPGILGTWYSLFYTSRRVFFLYTTTIYQCIFESCIIKRRNFVTRTIADSQTARMLTFMCCSALILNAKREQLYRGFWFLVPANKLKNAANIAIDEENNEVTDAKENTQKCSHTEQKCSAYIFNGLRNYLAIGLTLDLIKIILMRKDIPSKEQIGWFSKLLGRLKNFRFESGAFLGYYSCVYRIIHCLATRQFSDNVKTHLAAGFIAGSAYAFLPRITLLSYAFVTSVRLLWMLGKQMNKDNSIQSLQTNVNKCPTGLLSTAQYALRWLQRLPIENILYPLGVGYVVHVYVLRRRKVGNLGEIISNAVTNQYARQINQKIEMYEKLLSN